MPGVKGVIGVTGVRGTVAGDGPDEEPGPSWTAAESGERSEVRSTLCSDQLAAAGVGRPSWETVRRVPGWRELLVA